MHHAAVSRRRLELPQLLLRRPAVVLRRLLAGRGVVGELELRMFIRSYKPTMISSEDTPVVDITVSASSEEASDLERLHYHRIPININGGEQIFGNAVHGLNKSNNKY